MCECANLSSCEGEQPLQLLSWWVGAAAGDKDGACRWEESGFVEQSSGLSLQSIEPGRWKVVGHLIRLLPQPLTSLYTLPHLQECGTPEYHNSSIAMIYIVFAPIVSAYSMVTRHYYLGVTPYQINFQYIIPRSRFGIEPIIVIVQQSCWPTHAFNINNSLII